MSTRAVYSFVNKGQVPVHVYKHCDGNPIGAAQFIANIVKDNDGDNVDLTNQQLATLFITQNQGEYSTPELTTNYRDHGDIEYRYEITHNETTEGICVRAYTFVDTTGNRTIRSHGFETLLGEYPLNIFKTVASNLV